MNKLILILLPAVNSLSAFANRLMTYIAPQGAEPAPEFEVEVNGQKIFVYNTRTAAFAYFSFEGKVEVKLTFLACL